jgi:hypothetical protein
MRLRTPCDSRHDRLSRAPHVIVAVRPTQWWRQEVGDVFGFDFKALFCKDGAEAHSVFELDRMLADFDCLTAASE